MKRFILIIFLFFGLLANAQNVITFMGIPIDGSVSAFNSKLQEKGFAGPSVTGCFYGKFNGRSAEISLRANNDKVYEVVVIYGNLKQDEIISVYNALVSQFSSKSKYKAKEINTLPYDYNLPYNEDYSRIFCQSTFTTTNYVYGLITISASHIYFKGYNSINIIIKYFNSKNQSKFDGSDL